MPRDPWVGESDSLAEQRFWAADFSAMLTNDARLLSQACFYTGQDATRFLHALPADFASLVRGRQMIADQEYEASASCLSDALQSEHPYVKTMAGYYRGRSNWATGTDLAKSIDEVGVNAETQFGRAMATLMFAWHQQRQLDFKGHLRSLCEAAVEFMRCDPHPVYWIAQTLVPLLHTAFEMADDNAMALGRMTFNAVEWTADLEHEKFDCLRALSRHEFARGDTKKALTYIAAAKMCKVPGSCKAYAFLHSAAYAIESGEPTWATEQLIVAESQLENDRDHKCKNFCSVVLSLALQYAEIEPQKAQGYLFKYHQCTGDPSASTAYDGRMNVVADISLGKISLALHAEETYGAELLERAYDAVSKYGFRYRAAISASEIASVQTSRKKREHWMNESLRHIDFYGASSPLRKLLRRKMQRVTLTEREQRVNEMLLRGLASKDIAESLTLSEQSVRNVTTVIYRKLGVSNRKEFLCLGRT